MASASLGWTAFGTPVDDGGPAATGPDGRLELADLGRLARRATRTLAKVARADERETLSHLLHAHLAAPVEDLDVVEESRPGYDHVNVQAGLDAWLAADHRSHRLVGVVGYQHRPFGLAELLEGVGGRHDPFGPRPGNVSRVNLPSGPGGRVASCVRCGLYLVDDHGSPLAVLLRGAEPESGLLSVTVEITGADAARVADAARDIQELAARHNVFRGQVLSFDHEVFGHGGTLLQFHERPAVGAEDVILPAVAAESIRRQVVDVARHKKRLLSAGQHLKRGLLLYGPPGVGKTHTVRHLVSSLTDTTVIQLTGGALELISEACSVARALQPAMVVVEDVDLIAEDRELHGGAHPLLFQLLGEMDGLAEDADVVFVLTTNRADLLEPALAARPGRVDQAVELPLPDAEARRRLVDLYCGTLRLDRSNLDAVVERTEGVTASFIKELLRRAALFAAEHSEDGDGLDVSAADLDAALSELLDTRNAMTRVVLGGAGGATSET